MLVSPAAGYPSICEDSLRILYTWLEGECGGEGKRAEPSLAYMTLCELEKGHYSSRYFTAICWKIVITLYKSLMTVR